MLDKDTVEGKFIHGDPHIEGSFNQLFFGSFQISARGFSYVIRIKISIASYSKQLVALTLYCVVVKLSL